MLVSRHVPIKPARAGKPANARAFHENLLRSFEPGRRVWPWLGIEKIRRRHVKPKLARGAEDDRLLLRRDNPALFPSLDRRGVLVTEGAAQCGQTPEFGDDRVDRFHEPTIRILRTNVNDYGRGTRIAAALILSPMDATSSPAEAAAKLRARAGVSMKKLARELGYSDASSIQRYFKEDQFGKKPLPVPFVEKLVAYLPGRGSPAIQVHEVISLAGPVATQMAGGPFIGIMERLVSEMTQMRQQQTEMMGLIAHILSEMHRRQE